MDGSRCRVAAVHAGPPTGPPAGPPTGPPTINIQSLPPEVLLHVFSFLPPAELSETVAKVCAQWAGLHKHPSLYTSLAFNNSASTNVIVKCIRLAPWIDSLALAGNDFNLIFSKLYKHRVQVNKLNLHAGFDAQCQLHSVDGYVFLKVFKTCPKMHTLKLIGFEGLSASFYKHLSVMFTELRVVHLIALKRLCYGTVLNITIRCPHLEEIRVHGIYHSDPSAIVCLTDIELITLCERLRTTLRVLHIDYTEWSAKALNSLKHCRRLQDLGFYRASSMTSEALVMLETFTLRKLRITCSQLPTENAWLHLIRSPAMKNLESLELTECSFTNKVAIAIGDNLGNLNKLALILVVKCFCIPDSRQIFSSGLHSIVLGCSKLKHLEMSCMDLDTQSAIPIIALFLPGLKKLCIAPKANPEPKWMDSLKSKMPDLVINSHISTL